MLAGGYAKRLWPLTLNTPKALLPIAGKPILDYIIEKLEAIQPPLTRIVLSTNDHFQPQFKEWLASRDNRNVLLLPDASNSEEQKPGAIKAIANIVAFAGEDAVIVLAGDGIFNDNLSDMVALFRKKNAPVVSLYSVKNLEEAKRCGIAATDNQGQIKYFAEKPAQPQCLTACGAIYIFPKTVSKRLAEYLKLGLPTDQPGMFVEWLYKQEPVYGYTLKDYLWDIGTHEAYKECNEHFMTPKFCK